MDYGLFPHVVLDGLNAENKLIDEVETTIRCFSYSKTGSNHKRAEWKLEEEKKKLEKLYYVNYEGESEGLFKVSYAFRTA